MAVAVAPSAEPPWSRAAGVAPLGSRTSASRVGASVEARQVARNASASREVSACRSTASPSRFCSARPKAESARAAVSESLPRSSRAAISGARRRASVSRRSTQRGFRPRILAMAVSESWSSSRREATTRASSIGLAVLAGVLASRRRAFMAARVSTASTTTGISPRPSARQRARRLNPSRTSNVSPAAATRSGNVARSDRSVRSPRSGASEVRSRAISTSITADPPAGESERAGSGRR